jgi:hypothetical protein
MSAAIQCIDLPIGAASISTSSIGVSTISAIMPLATSYAFSEDVA